MENKFYHIFKVYNYKSGELCDNINLDINTLCGELSEYFENVHFTEEGVPWSIDIIKEALLKEMANPENGFNEIYPGDGTPIIRLYYSDTIGNLVALRPEKIVNELATYIFENWSE